MRGWYGYAAICFVASLVTFGLSGLVFPFLINKHYAKHLLEQGYQPDSEQDRIHLQMMGIIFSQPTSIKHAINKEVA